jgi:hypothetical protein
MKKIKFKHSIINKHKYIPIEEFDDLLNKIFDYIDENKENLKKDNFAFFILSHLNKEESQIELFIEFNGEKTNR